MKRYVIMARENWPGAPIKEVCRCLGRPADLKNALTAYCEPGPFGTLIPKYCHVEILEIPPEGATAQMKRADRNVKPISQETCVKLMYILTQIDAMRAGNGEQAAPQGQAAEGRSAVPQRQPEAEP